MVKAYYALKSLCLVFTRDASKLTVYVWDVPTYGQHIKVGEITISIDFFWYLTTHTNFMLPNIKEQIVIW